jgi:predicted Zn-dependent protease
MTKVYEYRSYQDPTIGLDDNAVGLAVAFPERMFALGEFARRNGDTTRWEYWLREAREQFPFYARAHEQVASFQRLRGDSTAAEQTLKDGLSVVRRYSDEMPDNRMYWYFTAQMAGLVNDQELAERAMARAFWLNPNDGMIFGDYAAILQSAGKTAELTKIAQKYLTYYPNDQRARQMLSIRK